MKPSDAELKPCPFCGGKAEFSRIGTTRVSCLVACEDCGASLETGETGDMCGKQWNTRTQSQQPASVPAELVEQWHDEWCLAVQSGGMKGVTLFAHIATQAAAYGREQAQWVPVSERLPEHGKPVLLLCDLSPDCDPVMSVGCRTYCEYGWSIFDAGACKENSLDITHWMPLPEPPTC